MKDGGLGGNEDYDEGEMLGSINAVFVLRCKAIYS